MRTEERKLRICIASSGLGHVTRGIEAWADDLGNELAARGEQIVLCKGSGSVEAPHQRVIPCWIRSSRSTKRLLDFMPKSLGWRIGMGAPYGVEQTTFAWNLIRFLRRQRTDVLHLQDPQVAILLQRARRTGWIPTRTILNHGTEEPFEFQEKIEFLQHGAPWHQQQAEAAGIWRDSWTMIPNFVDPSRFQPGSSPLLRDEFDIPQQAIVVLVSAAIKRRHKRIDHLIGELKIVRGRRPDLPLWLVIAGGRDHDTDALVQEARAALADRVRFAIGFPRNRMPDLYRMADFLVHGSLKEMMPMALLEATASGLPCLVHPHPVMQWMIGPGGRAIDMQRTGALADSIANLASDASTRAQLGQLARQHCVTNFSRDRVVDRLLRYYQNVHLLKPTHSQKAA